jgi:hypothetical protein
MPLRIFVVFAGSHVDDFSKTQVKMHSQIELPRTFSIFTGDGSHKLDDVSVTENPVLLPGAFLLLAPGLAGVAATRRRFKK